MPFLQLSPAEGHCPYLVIWSRCVARPTSSPHFTRCFQFYAQSKAHNWGCFLLMLADNSLDTKGLLQPLSQIFSVSSACFEARFLRRSLGLVQSIRSAKFKNVNLCPVSHNRCLFKTMTPQLSLSPLSTALNHLHLYPELLGSV